MSAVLVTREFDISQPCGSTFPYFEAIGTPKPTVTADFSLLSSSEIGATIIITRTCGRMIKRTLQWVEDHGPRIIITVRDVVRIEITSNCDVPEAVVYGHLALNISYDE